MPRLVVKLLSDDDQTDLATALAAYKAGAGSELDTKQRGQAVAEFREHDADLRAVMAFAHAGTDLPASGSKTADLQHLDVQADGELADLQAAIDAALADAVHHEAVVADADTTVAGKVTSAAGTPFASTDVGRKIRIGSEVRTITAYNANDDVDYDNSADEGGDFTSGSGLTLDLLGAESLQSIDMTVSKDEDGDPMRMRMLLAVEGEAY